ncbi:hypothetical protein [Yellowstone lake phycodnavirus 3]|uniref:virion structural protein n=1 Tax=Yellowstone lake phycodnavirus 3 TaxID=1586715 RepID=UPI0006EBBAA1|nr:virion structural protein [Yellowstone lake phycodnavirus 3]BAT22673.1 hypothetical protein [Yellowstone lake phycodnavirus 3]
MNINGTQGSPYQGLVQTRPYDFGTDAIERQRVSLGQSLIDADFEYGLQATKWQTYQELRKFPSFFEVPGTDFTVSNVQVDGTIGANVTVYFSNVTSVPPATGSVISVSGLVSSDRKSGRAEGFFLVSNVNAAANTCNYVARGQILTSVSNISTPYTVIRKGGIFNSSQMEIPVAFISADVSPGTNVAIRTSNAHGLVAGTPITSNASGLTFNGSFFVSNVLSANTFNVVCDRTVTASLALSNIYPQPYSYSIHRPYDGGVILGTNQPSHGASIVRQSKKVFRYQSGKGLLWSSGTLFAPNNDIASLTVSGTTITVVTDIPHGAPQNGATIVIKGVASPSTVNGTYTIASVTDSKTLVINSSINYPAGTTIQFAEQPRFIISTWHGASVRVGTFDDQNGMFWEYDGQTLFATRRTATLQLDGYIQVDPRGQLMSGQIVSSVVGVTSSASTGVPAIPTGSSNVNVTGLSAPLAVGAWAYSLAGYESLGPVWVTAVQSTSAVTLSFAPSTVAYPSPGDFNATTFNTSNTRFADQLKVDDRFVIRGMTHQVVQIQGQGLLSFNPPYRGSAPITAASPVKACKVKDLRTPQNLFNRDTLDGSGSSGFKFDASKMQMLGLQYTWYGAGFVDFMMRGVDGNWVYAHRIKNNNVNDEAYMRTGNMPVRYEIVNESGPAATTLATAMGPTDTSITVADSTLFFPPSGTLLIDNEQVSYAAKTTNGFTGLTRASALNYVVNDVPRTFTGAASSNHNATTTVNLLSVTCAPSLTHWGSAFLMDGSFDQDRGYYFNYANTNISVTSGSTAAAFAIRLAPSVSNGIVGDIGVRELLNRAQILLQKLEVTSSNTVNTTGILNPSGITFDPARWININTVANGSQPSFAQIYPGGLISGTAAQPGERIFSSIVQGNNQNNLDLTGLKEMSNAVIGGNQPFPDGPDVLLILVSNFTAGPSGPVQCNLFWTEAQA